MSLSFVYVVLCLQPHTEPLLTAEHRDIVLLVLLILKRPAKILFPWRWLGWVGFFLTHHSGLGQKISSTLSNPIHAHSYSNLIE